ncbi:DUF3857 domain-containing protein [Acidipila sp. EB88]|uniref:DUF3857 domain-containing protein n=1 Tax=Acidipila sp. EB88 TaxID=2305226 RepID=UPI000F5F6929|nr:DUF3857 domain-containing protein [Acidipila sp. EB88]RRA48710.1 DUF3857 domain-containing protein [Acidipila sp. EB88]
MPVPFLLRTSAAILSLSALPLLPMAHASSLPMPTPQELNMQAPAEDPGANAVYLSYDESDSDQTNVHIISVRLKVLTQAGVERYSDVQVGMLERRFGVEDVEAQTVHTDGRVIPFTGKPFQKTMHRRGETYKAVVFSMPDVQVGSILEYRYRLSYADNILLPAHWYVQQDAFVLHAHYIFRPFQMNGSKYVTVDHDQIGAGLFYVSSLPKGAKFIPSNGVGHAYYELTAENIPALPDEDALPPTRSFSYRMLFYYAAQTEVDSYWAKEGKFLSKDMNTFAVAGPKMRADIPGLFAPGDSAEVKTRKLYLAAMKMENTNFTRQHTQEENQAQGLHAVRTAEDIWVRQRGSGDEIALTFLAMLRTAGLRAYGMKVTNRDQNIFEPLFIDTSQLDDTIVIASIDGKEVFLDPGQRFCPYGQLAWKHSWARGVRQTEDGTAIASAGTLSYKDTVIARTAILGLRDDGEASGTLTLLFSGQEALRIRQRETGEAVADTKQRFEEEARAMLPGGMQLHVITMDDLDDGEKPLKIVFGIRGPIGTGHGRRLILPQALLRQNEQESFTSPSRKNDVYFHYPYVSTDVVQLSLPDGIKPEGVPPEKKAQALDLLAYNVHTTVTGSKVQMVRTVAMGAVLVPVAQYPKLREFLGGLRSADEEQLLLVQQATPTAAGGEANAAGR